MLVRGRKTRSTAMSVDPSGDKLLWQTEDAEEYVTMYDPSIGVHKNKSSV